MQDLLYMVSLEAAEQDPFVRLSVKCVYIVYERSPQKNSASDLKVRSLSKLSEVSEQDSRSLHHVSAQNLYQGAPGKIAV